MCTDIRLICFYKNNGDDKMGKKEMKAKERDFIQSEILRSKLIAYTLDENLTNKIVISVMNVLKQYFSKISRILASSSQPRIQVESPCAVASAVR